jgi:ABC-type glycerol-3-phosphate transport system substrate-binding protein
MKRTVAILLAAVMMLAVLAGCGGNTASESTAPESTAPESSSAESTAPEATAWKPESDLVIYVGAAAGGTRHEAECGTKWLCWGGGLLKYIF